MVTTFLEMQNRYKMYIMATFGVVYLKARFLLNIFFLVPKYVYF